MQRGEAVPQQARDAAESHPRIAQQPEAEQHRRRGLEHVARERQQSGVHPEYARHIRRPGVAAAVSAYVAPQQIFRQQD